MNFERLVPVFLFAGILFSVVALAATTAIAQPGSVDLTFDARPSNPLPTTTNFQQVVQPDGKIVVYNAPTMLVSGEPRGGIYRLNTDGSVDPTFNYCNCGGIGVNNIMIAPDGKLVLAGTASPNHAKMIRLNSDGSIDNSFLVFITAVGPPEFTGNWLYVNAIQPDGKVIATHGSWGNIAGTWYSYSMRRYNLDASIDSSFTSPTLNGGHLVNTSAIIEPLPDGRFYLAISSGSHLGGGVSITRRLANGAVDPTYTEFTRSISSGFYLNIRDLAATPDGGVLAAGFFWPSMIGGPYNRNLYKLLPSGAVDPGFNPPLSNTSDGVHLLPDGKVLYSAALTSGAATRIMRLAADGSVDSSYVMDPAITSIVNTWQADPAGRPIFLAQIASERRLVRLLENGSIDPSFNPNMGVPGFVNTVAVQTDGKLIVSGPFTGMNGTTRARIARVNSDGSLDPTFDPGSGFGSNPAQIAIQTDGKILAAGGFITYNGAAVPGIVRINTDGSIDNSFSVNPSSPVNSVALQPDGKILIGGPFTTVNGVNRTAIARLETNGTLDPSFDVVLGGSPSVSQILIEANGKIVIGGVFSGVNGQTRDNLARLESSGALDATFNATVNSVLGLWRQPDGKYVVRAGSQGTEFGRRNNDGSLDVSFAPPILAHGSTPSIRSVLPLPDGGLLIGGRFTTVNGVPRNHITRLRHNGAVDPAFMPNGAAGDVLSLVWYPGGRIMVGGEFASIDSIPRLGVARLNASVLLRETPFDFDGDGRADFTAYRPSTGVWHELSIGSGTYVAPTFGLAGDIPVPADFDGDGKTDEAIYRPSYGDWWYLSSVNGTHGWGHHGIAGDIPRPGDFDGDGKADFIVYRPSNGMWYRWGSAIGEAVAYPFGQAGDIPLVGDFDGDGRVDPAVFRPSTGDWWYAASSAGQQHRSTHWGANGDIPAPADFDGDGKTDVAVFRPSNGGWYVLKSGDLSFIIRAWGVNGDRPVPADYDGDGRADIAVFRPSDGVWYLFQSTSGTGGVQWGIASDVVAPNAFLP